MGGALTGIVQPRYVIGASTLVAACGIFLFTNLDVRSTSLDIIIPVVVMAFGMGFGMAQRTNIIASVVPDKEIGIASSVLALARNIAGAFGIALFATLLNNSIESHVLSISRETTVSSASPLIYLQAVGLIILKAQIPSYRTVFLVASAVLLVGAPLAFLFIDIKQDGKGAKVHVE